MSRGRNKRGKPWESLRLLHGCPCSAGPSASLWGPFRGAFLGVHVAFLSRGWAGWKPDPFLWFRLAVFKKIPSDLVTGAVKRKNFYFWRLVMRERKLAFPWIETLPPTLNPFWLLQNSLVQGMGRRQTSGIMPELAVARKNTLWVS